MKKKSRPLCEKPRSGVFCGSDKYLTLQEYTVTEEMYPVMELDSYFVFVRKGKGIFIINGEEFPVETGCMAWIQATQVLTICPDFGCASGYAPMTTSSSATICSGRSVPPMSLRSSTEFRSSVRRAGSCGRLNGSFASSGSFAKKAAAAQR